MLSGRARVKPNIVFLPNNKKLIPTYIMIESSVYHYKPNPNDLFDYAPCLPVHGHNLIGVTNPKCVSIETCPQVINRESSF